MTASGRGSECGGIEQKGKRTRGRGQQCGDCGVGVGYKGAKMIIEKNTVKILKGYIKGS